MSDIKQYTLEEILKMKSKSDKAKFDATTEKDIIEQSMADEDTPIPTKKERKEFKLSRDKKNE